MNKHAHLYVKVNPSFLPTAADNKECIFPSSSVVMCTIAAGRMERSGQSCDPQMCLYHRTPTNGRNNAQKNLPSSVSFAIADEMGEMMIMIRTK